MSPIIERVNTGLGMVKTGVDIANTGVGVAKVGCEVRKLLKGKKLAKEHLPAVSTAEGS